MSATIRQFRFYGYDSKDNYAGGAKENGGELKVGYNNLVSGELFFAKQNLSSAIQIGIQTLPGTVFYLSSNQNGSSNAAVLNDYGIVVGKTGIYELDVSNLGIVINSLRFNGVSIDDINNNPSGYLIVDIIYSDNQEGTE